MKVLVTAAMALLLLSCNRNQNLTIEGKDFSWIQDTAKAGVIQGENFVYFFNKSKGPKAITGEIQSKQALAMITEHEAATRALAGKRTFIIEFNQKEFAEYMGNVNTLSAVEKFRFYYGVYPSGHTNPSGQTDSGRFSGILVAVGKDGKEKYLDGKPGLQMVNVGTLCPTICPKDDSLSLYMQAKLPEQ
jgi:hypothetical protein